MVFFIEKCLILIYASIISAPRNPQVTFIEKLKLKKNRLSEEELEGHPKLRLQSL